MTVPVVSFAAAGLAGEVRAGDFECMIDDDLPRLLDPGRARRTIHWGRNYLFVTDARDAQGEPFPVVVKQFRNDSLRQRLDRRFRGTKAERSWRVALALEESGLPTPEPLLWADSEEPTGPAFYVCRYLPDRIEARDFVRALNAGEERERFPETPALTVLSTLAELARALHEAGFWHRDYSAGNVLLDLEAEGLRPALVDLNRTRRVGDPSLSQRMRDLCRMPLERAEHQNLLLSAYFRGEPPARARRLYRRYHRAFHGRHRWKKRARGGWARIRELVAPPRAHPHLPPPPSDAGRRDRAVWDALSDQPHQHAGRWDKLLVRLGDVGDHVRMLRGMIGPAPRIWKSYRALKRDLYREPVPFRGLGVCLRPCPEDPEGLLAAVDDLGMRDVLLRLHPWEEEHDAEEELARELSRRGHRLVFALPQRRELVRDPARWRAAVEELAERFLPYGNAFQIGQAINRSKWGIWNPGEFQTLAEIAFEVLRSHPDVEIVGPGVIDFELHYTAAVLNWPGSEVRFDAVANLLYVDRRGAPENRQSGFDTVDKVVLAHAVASTARCARPRTWITEVNWPLQEGPHAPAGREVSVGEEEAADYLARYYLLALGTGLVERVYWWQLVARGYGLMVVDEGGLRPRPAYHALRTLLRLDGATFEGPLATGSDHFAYRFRLGGEARTVVAAWTRRDPGRLRLPGVVERAWARDGEPLCVAEGGEVSIGSGVRYFEIRE